MSSPFTATRPPGAMAWSCEDVVCGGLTPAAASLLRGGWRSRVAGAPAFHPAHCGGARVRVPPPPAARRYLRRTPGSSAGGRRRRLHSSDPARSHNPHRDSTVYAKGREASHCQRRTAM